MAIAAADIERLIKERFPNNAGTRREKWSVLWMNILLIPLVIGMILERD